MNTDKTFEEKMAALRLQFFERLENWQTELNHLDEQALPWSDKDIEHFIFVAHKLAGSGGTYGYPDISNKAKPLENELRALQGNNGDQNTAKEQLQSLMHSINDALNDKNIDDKSDTSNSSVETENIHTPDDLPPAILLVDDDQNVHDLVKSLIEHKARIHSVYNADQAFEKIKRARPDMILLDDKMAEGMSGMEMLDQIKQTANLNDIPVIMLTASDKPREVLHGLVSGADDYITKPFDPKAFAQKIIGRLNKMRTSILIADDDEAVSALLAHKFESRGCQVLIANNGRKALELMQNKSPSLVILDRMMPEMDGLAVLQKMRELTHLETVPVVFLTAKHSENDIIDGLNQGAEDYIVKPFNPDEVVVRCMRHLK